MNCLQTSESDPRNVKSDKKKNHKNRRILSQNKLFSLSIFLYLLLFRNTETKQSKKKNGIVLMNWAFRKTWIKNGNEG